MQGGHNSSFDFYWKEFSFTDCDTSWINQKRRSQDPNIPAYYQLHGTWQGKYQRWEQQKIKRAKDSIIQSIRLNKNKESKINALNGNLPAEHNEIGILSWIWNLYHENYLTYKWNWCFSQDLPAQYQAK